MCLKRNLFSMLFCVLCLQFVCALAFGEHVFHGKGYAHAPQYMYLLDGFEIENEWEVRYSKNRAKVIRSQDNTQNAPRDPDTSLYSWFTADGKSFSPEELLPPFLYYFQKVFNKATQDPNQATQKTILGLQARWDFPGYNVIDVLPKHLETEPRENRYSPNKKGRYPDEMYSVDTFHTDHYENYTGANYILVPGLVREVSVYVLSSYYPGKLEFHFEDKIGNRYVLEGGTLGYMGWRKIQAALPKHLYSDPFYISRAWPLKFMGMRIILNPEQYKRLYKLRQEQVFYLYFDALSVQVDVVKDNYAGQHKALGEYIWREGKQLNSQN